MNGETHMPKNGLRQHTPLIMVLLFVALIINFIVFVLYLRELQINNDLLKVCDPIRICGIGGG